MKVHYECEISWSALTQLAKTAQHEAAVARATLFPVMMSCRQQSRE